MTTFENCTFTNCTFTDTETVVALALKKAAEEFRSPVPLYVEPEARKRWEEAHPDGYSYAESADFELESWKILARAALCALRNT